MKIELFDNYVKDRLVETVADQIEQEANRQYQLEVAKMQKAHDEKLWRTAKRTYLGALGFSLSIAVLDMIFGTHTYLQGMINGYLLGLSVWYAFSLLERRSDMINSSWLTDKLIKQLSSPASSFEFDKWYKVTFVSGMKDVYKFPKMHLPKMPDTKLTVVAVRENGDIFTITPSLIRDIEPLEETN